jgi:hypothetical protein
MDEGDPDAVFEGAGAHHGVVRFAVGSQTGTRTNSTPRMESMRAVSGDWQS